MQGTKSVVLMILVVDAHMVTLVRPVLMEVVVLGEAVVVTLLLEDLVVMALVLALVEEAEEAEVEECILVTLVLVVVEEALELLVTA